MFSNSRTFEKTLILRQIQKTKKIVHKASIGLYILHAIFIIKTMVQIRNA
jgi:hypothetical protein